MLVDSKKQKLSDQAVLMVAAQEAKSTQPASAIYASAVIEMKMKDAIPYREGNTIFVIHRVKDRLGTYRALNADTDKNFLENYYSFVQAAYHIGFDVLYTTFQDETVLNVFKAIFRSPPQKGMGFNPDRLDQGFGVTLQLGPDRGVLQ